MCQLGILTILITCPLIFEQLNPLVTPALDIRRAAKETALREIDSQREQFRSLAIMADWDSKERTYRTLGMCRYYKFLCFTYHSTFFFKKKDHHYIIRQLRIFQKMVEKGLFLRLPFPWPTSFST